MYNWQLLIETVETVCRIYFWLILIFGKAGAWTCQWPLWHMGGKCIWNDRDSNTGPLTDRTSTLTTVRATEPHGRPATIFPCLGLNNYLCFHLHAEKKRDRYVGKSFYFLSKFCLLEKDKKCLGIKKIPVFSTNMPKNIRFGRSEILFIFCQLFICWFLGKIASWGLIFNKIALKPINNEEHSMYDENHHN